MGKLPKIPLVSFLLLTATYGVFGWLYAAWVTDLAAKAKLWHGWLAPQSAFAISYGLGLLVIIWIIVFFTSPMSLLTLGMDNWLRADAKALFAIALSIVIFALVVEYPIFLTRSLILSATAILFRLDLQTVGCSHTLARYLLVFLSIVLFAGGVFFFHLYGVDL